MNLGTAQIIQGNALNLPLPDASVDLICTSPPYFGLRSYQDAGVHYDGQIGSEATPAEFLDALLAATREMVRVLKPSGSLFINLGDKYAQTMGQFSRGHQGGNIAASKTDHYIAAGAGSDRNLDYGGIRPKSLLGIPWRYAIACIDQLGLILRAEIIWSKPNGLPESVTDRVRRSHETWFHFTRSPRYFAAVDEIREPHDDKNRPNGYRGGDGISTRDAAPKRDHLGRTTFDPKVREYNPLGKLPGSVWTVPTQPLKVPPELGVDHFAAFPFEFPRRIIQGWTPNGVCTVCGEGRRPSKGVDWSRIPHRMVEKRVCTEEERREAGRLLLSWRQANGATRSDFVPHFPHYKNADSITAQVSNWELGKNVPVPDDLVILERWLGPAPERLRQIITQTSMVPVSLLDVGEDVIIAGRHNTTGGGLQSSEYTIITGYVCGCRTPNAPTTPGVILDPFGGTGTTALVAKALGRIGITIDLSADYCRLAEWRCNDPGQLAQALQIEKPEPISPDQLSLFGEPA